MARYTGILLGSFNDFDDVVMDRSCVERNSYEQALEDAKHMQKMMSDPDAKEWTPSVESAA